VRSDLVFMARDRVSNPFLLCHLVRLSTRSFHRNNVAVQETINKALTALSKHKCPATGLDANAFLQKVVGKAETEVAKLEFARAA
jgi:hypothetical protein